MAILRHPRPFIGRNRLGAILLALIAALAGSILPLSPALAQTPSFPAPPSLPSSPPPPTPAPVPASATPAPEARTDAPAEDKTAALAVPVTASTLNSMEVLDDKIKLDSGDHISFRVLEDQDDAVQRIVTDSGEVDFPYVGRINVAGKTCSQVAWELKKLLEVDYYYKATVIIGLDTIHGQSGADGPHNFVWVVGQVKQVGPQEIPAHQPLTVSQAIVRANGFADFSDQRRVKLIHHVTSETANEATRNAPADSDLPKDVIIVDVKAVFDGKSDNDPVVQPNDMIVVPKRSINF